MSSSPIEQDACELLDADHIAVKHLFVEYVCLAYAGPQNSSVERRALAKKISRELTLHMQLEEEIFYPAIRAAQPDAEARLAEAEQEHRRIKELIAQIGRLDAKDAGLDDRVAQLARAVEHHVKEERDELFPKAKAASKIDLASLCEKLRGRQQALEAADLELGVVK